MMPRVICCECDAEDFVYLTFLCQCPAGTTTPITGEGQPVSDATLSPSE